MNRNQKILIISGAGLLVVVVAVVIIVAVLLTKKSSSSSSRKVTSSSEASSVISSSESSSTSVDPWLGTAEFGAPSASTLSSQIALDSDKNIYFAGNTGGSLNGVALNGNQDAFIVKFDQTGTPQWTQLLGATGASVATNGCAIGSDGSLYISGNVSGSLPGNTATGSEDLFVAKYNLSGTRSWVKQMGVANQTAYGRAVKVGASGNVYVAGHTGGGLNGNTMTGTRDMYVAKFDTNGNVIWLKQLGVATKATYGINLDIDSSENAFVVGYTLGSLDGNTLTGTTDAFITKYDTNGNKLWTKQQGVSGVVTRSTGIAVDSNGNALVGDTRGSLNGNTLAGIVDLTITKYDTSGNRLLSIQHGAANTSMSYPMVALDQEQDIILTAYTSGGFDGQVIRGIQDMSTIKFDALGNRLWTRLMGNTDGVGNTTGVATDTNDNIYVPGNTTVGVDGNTSIGTLDSVLLKYTSSGELVR
jgi:hypothetical protein